MTNDRPERWIPPDLSSGVACVAGASYGVGRAVAEVLGECGATVYVTARSTRSAQSREPAWTVEDTAALVDDAGGRGIPVRVDHTSKEAVDALFARIRRDHGRLDLLVNNVWQWGPKETYWAPTWEQPPERWDAMFGVGARSLFLAAAAALPLMLDSGGLIIATQERPGDDQHFAHNIVVDAAAAAMKRMVEYLGHELADTEVTALLLYFGWVRTVNAGMGFDSTAARESTEVFESTMRMTRAEFARATQSPHFVGRAIAALAADPEVKTRSGQSLAVAQLALDYGFTDEDGRVPDADGVDLAD